MAATSKRLIKELRAYQAEPSPALSSLEPRSDEDLMQMTAVLRGPEGTAYEGAITRYVLEEDKLIAR